MNDNSTRLDEDGIREAINGAEQIEWPDPRPVAFTLPAVRAFEDCLLPEVLRGWIADLAERAQCPPDYAAAGAIVEAAALIGRRLAVRPKRHDDWRVIPNLWGMVVGPPGVLKSPMLAEAMKPLRRLEVGAHDQFKAQMREYEVCRAALQAQRKAMQEEMVKAFKKGQDVEAHKEKLASLGDDEPIERRYIVNDPTVEKLGIILNENPAGVLLFRDELIGFLATMERAGHEADRGFYLESWNGDGAYAYDRVGRGTLRIEAACVSILGAITPGPLDAYLQETFEGAKDDGFIQRFQVAVYPDVPRTWRNVDRYPDTPAKQKAFEFFERLNTLDPLSVGAKKRGDDDDIPAMRFTEEGQELFDRWRAELEAKLRREDESPIIIAHLAKYRSLMPALALIFHLADPSDGAVSVDAAVRAADWCGYLESHARRIYEAVINRVGAAAVALSNKVRDGKLPNPFAARDVDRAQWSGLTNPDDVRSAIDVLVESGWLRREAINLDGPGRQGEQLWINPKVANMKVDSNDE
jgi:putative DNA primase/helicase